MKIQLIAKNAPTYKKDTARDKWFKAVLKHEGKSTNTFLKAAEKYPPTLKKDGTAEAPRGWLNYFVREGVVKLSAK